MSIAICYHTHIMYIVSLFCVSTRQHLATNIVDHDEIKACHHSTTEGTSYHRYYDCIRDGGNGSKSAAAISISHCI